jgi:hypothetical protein
VHGRWVGTYRSAEEAARAYDAAAFVLHGARARTNFHYSQEEVAQLSSMDPAQQQVGAGTPISPWEATWRPGVLLGCMCVHCLCVWGGGRVGGVCCVLSEGLHVSTRP